MKKSIWITLVAFILVVAATGCGKKSLDQLTEAELEAYTKQVSDELDKQSTILADNSEAESIPDLTIDDCVLWQLGTDVQNQELFGKDPGFTYTFLFPNESFVRQNEPGLLTAPTPKITMCSLRFVPVDSYNRSGYEEEIYSSGDVQIARRVQHENLAWAQYDYSLRDGENVAEIRINISGSTDYADEIEGFIADYIPAFEQSLLDNFNGTVAYVPAKSESNTSPANQEAASTSDTDIIGDADVIGDRDMSGEFTIDSCMTWVLGLDLGCPKYEGNVADFDFGFSFPAPAYTCEESDGHVRAVVNGVDVIVDVAAVKASKMSSGEQIEENNGKKITRYIENDARKSFTSKYYMTAPRSSEYVAEITVAFASTDENAFAKFKMEYLPQFEAVLVENIY